MHNIEILIFLLSSLVALGLLANKIKIPLPILLLLSGLAISLMSQNTLVTLKPQVVFLLFLPTLLYEAAHRISWHEFKTWYKQILSLAIGLVLVTSVCVAIAAHYLIPDFTWALGFLLGALVAPPDAVAATTATRNLHLPKHVLAVIEGESLVNDSTALIAYQYAVLAVTTGSSFSLRLASFDFLFISGVGVGSGLLCGFIVIQLHKRITDPVLGAIISLLTPLTSYIIADLIGSSGVLSVVTCGIYVAWYTSEVTSLQFRLKIRELWEVLTFILNGVVFLLIGLQLHDVLKSLSSSKIIDLIGYGFLISAVVIITRIIWIFPMAIINIKIFNRNQKNKVILNAEIFKQLFVVSWSGMRGVVSLAAALAIPLTLSDGSEFPMRNEILFITFTVILITLILHGLTIPIIIRKFNVHQSDAKIALDLSLIQVELLDETVKFIRENMLGEFDISVIEKLELDAMSEIKHHKGEMLNESSTLNQLDFMRDVILGRLKIIQYQRELLHAMHKNNSYAKDIIRKTERDLDILHISLQTKLNNLLHLPN